MAKKQTVDRAAGGSPMLVHSHGEQLLDMAKREKLCASYFTRLVRLTYLTRHHPSHPRWPSDCREAARPFAAAAELARVTPRPRLHLIQLVLAATRRPLASEGPNHFPGR